MNWEQILGFFTMWPSPIITIGLWAKADIPIWQTVLYVSFVTSISLSLTYFGVEWLKKWVIDKKILSQATIERIQNLWRQGNNNIQKNGSEKKLTKKIERWLFPQRDWKLLACGFIPFIPALPTIVIIETALREIKCGFLILLLGNIARNIIFCYAVYQGYLGLNSIINFFYKLSS